ncbi:MAG TPA: LamG-like jellyroll fold domain-containing protein [Streptosporangiaceae bacterium]|nr:LamG-like jellyroll fold domain-containing protein [Streptosporangiaceae bacterium]
MTVTSQTTATSMTVAHPDGTFTATMYALPVRTKVRGRWMPVSTRLARTRSGWSPGAVPSRLTFSPGGTRPLVTMASPHGSLALHLPVRLPAPRIRGGTATYRNVLPGVSLSLTATTLGGVTLTFRVASVRAAASPALRHLHLTVTTRGLTARTDRTGNFAAVARGLGPVFSGPAAISWDSPATAGHHVAPASAGAELHPALHGSVLRINPDSALLRPASRYPAYISQSLTPDFPVRTIRPGSSSGVSPDTFTDTSTAGRANFLETQQGCPTSQNYDITQGSGSEAGNAIGYNFWSSCIGIYRSYYSFNVSASSSAWHVIAATLSINQTYSADLTCGDKWPITVYNLGNGQPFGSGSDWSNYQPSMTSTNQVGSTTVKVGEPACPDNSASFGIASTMQSAANANAGDWSFGFRGNETKNPSSGTPTDCATQNCGYGRWSNNPKIVTTFDESPPSPSAMTAVPTPTASPNAAADNGCGTTAGTGGWIGKTDIANNSSTADLKATFSASLASEDVQGKFNFWEETPSLKATSSTPGPSGYVLAPATISEPVGITLIDGASYQWNAVATVDGNGNDGGKTFSTTSTDTCGFRVDETAPAGLTVSSSAFPPLGSVPGTTLTTGDTGQFNFTGYDPIPTAGACSSGGCLASNVYEFEYELNSAIPTSIAAPTAPASCPAGGVADGQLFGVAATNPAGTSSNPATGASCPIKIGNWGENTLFVAAVDNAGNISQTFQYHFYVPWSGAAPVAGDVNGDGFPDLLAASSNGDLLLFPGRTDPTATPQIASTPAHSPVPGTGWNNFQITHRGSFSQFPVDDVFALRGAILYRYLNNTQAGTTPQFENTANAHIVNWPSCPTPLMETDPDNSANCTGYPTGWSQISQIVAPGDAWVGANPFSASTFGTQGITQDDGDPSLLAVSKSGQLWLFQGNGGGQLQDPIQLGASGWSNMTVIAPGTVNGTTVLWARDNSTGTLYSYPFVISANKVPTLNPTTPSSPIPAEGTGTTGTAISGAPTLTKAAYPTLTAALPLATGTGGCATGNPGYYCAGLYAIDSSGNIWYYSGQPGTSPISSNRQLYFSALSPSGSWQLNDGGACTTAADTSGNGNTGTLNGGATCSADPAAPATEPNPPTVDSFDGSTGYVSTNSPALATGSGNSFSVSAWVYLTTNTQWATAVSQDTSASDSGGAHNSSFKLMYRLDTNSWVFARPAANTTGSAVDYASSAALTSSDLNTWTQLTGTYNASTGLETLYVNGQQVGTTTDTTPFASTGSTVIGRDLVDGSQSDFFPGDIKDVQVYSYSLSAAQAEALYQAPAASLPLNGPDSTGVLADGTGDGYSATPGGGVTYPVDKYFGTVTDLDGSSGYAETPASAGPVIDTTHSFTVSAWAKLPAIPTHNSTIVSEQGNVNSSFYLQFNNAYDGNNRWAFVMAATDATGTGMYNAISAPGTVQTNTWTQLTGVYNSATGTAQLYVNGQFAASVSAAGFASVGPLDIGRALWAGNLQDYFPGEVTEVQAFPYALSPGAVDALYLGQAPISQIG